MNLLCVVIFLSVYSLWLVICLPFSLLGFVLPAPRRELTTEIVKLSPSVCKILNMKSLLSNEEYEFETQEVAPGYDLYTFSGYRLVMGPVIYTLKSYQFLDQLILKLVHQWVKVHKYWIDERIEKVSITKRALTYTLTSLAHGLGRTLYWVTPKGTYDV